MSERIKTVRFKVSQSNLLEWAESQPNFSAYVIGLIQRDFEARTGGPPASGPVAPELLQALEQIVLTRLASLGTPSPGQPHVPPPPTPLSPTLDDLGGLF